MKVGAKGVVVAAIAALCAVGCFATAQPMPVPTATPDIAAMVRAAIDAALDGTATPTPTFTPAPTATKISEPAPTPTPRPTASARPSPNPTQPNPPNAGSCWSGGESFTEVFNNDGHTHPVEPFQLRHLPGGEHIWLCGVLKSNVTPAKVPQFCGQLGLIGCFDEGFYLPSGEHIYIHPVDPSPKLWTLAAAQWLYE